jgi:hypothetical protein
VFLVTLSASCGIWREELHYSACMYGDYGRWELRYCRTLGNSFHSHNREEWSTRYSYCRQGKVKREEWRLLLTSFYLPRFRTPALWCWSKEYFFSFVLTTQRSIDEHEMTRPGPLANSRLGAMQGRLTLGALNIPLDLWRIYASKTDHRYHPQRLYRFNSN